MIKIIYIAVTMAVLSAPAAADEQRNLFGGDGGGLGELAGELRAAKAPVPEPAQLEPESRVSDAPESSRLSGFISRVEGEFHVHSNLYFTANGRSYLIEDFSGGQKFSLKDRDLYVTLSDAGEFRLGRINIDPLTLAERARAGFELERDITVSTVFHNWKIPDVSYSFGAGITGFGWITTVTERTERIIQLDLPEGGAFCYYTNIKSRKNQLLYRGACVK